MNGIVLRNPTKMTQNLISSSQRAADKVFLPDKVFFTDETGSDYQSLRTCKRQGIVTGKLRDIT